jgi:hypothetical protein
MACVAPGATSANDLAGASVGAKLQVFPTRPLAGRAATLQLRPYRLVSGRNEPALIAPDHRWHVTAWRRGHSIDSLHFSRDAADPYVWTASFRFGSAGRWVVRISGDRADAPLEIRVLHRGRVGTWARLERPLHTPTIAPGAPCPTSAPDPKGDLSRIGYVGPAWGVGPGYPVIPFDRDRPVLRYEDPIPPESLLYGSKWFGQKALWVVDRKAYRGPVLVRGRQVDGMNEVRFGLAPVPAPEQTISSLADAHASTTRIRAQGCHAYQVDGTTFSRVIVFEARPYPS